MAATSGEGAKPPLAVVLTKRADDLPCRLPRAMTHAHSMDSDRSRAAALP
jgi:hypothetical protein